MTEGCAFCEVGSQSAPAPPRPLLTPMTGGYRRTPVLQVGADIFCDTNIILPTLERLYPEPALYPAAFGALSQALSFNWEGTVWIPVIGVLVHFLGDLPPDFIRDRKDGYLYIDISKAAMEPEFNLNVQRVRAQLAWLKQALADGRKFLQIAPWVSTIPCAAIFLVVLTLHVLGDALRDALDSKLRL